MSFILLGILNAQAAGGGGAAAYDLLETQILASSASSVTFSSIPQDYKHLQIRVTARNTGAAGGEGAVTFNSDTTLANYRVHRLLGGGSSVFSFDSGNTNVGLFAFTGSDWEANHYAASVIDILDYANESKNTTSRSFMGRAQSGGFIVELASMLYMSTAAISTIQLSPQVSFEVGSRISLYGVR